MADVEKPKGWEAVQLIGASLVLVGLVGLFHWLAHGEYEVAIFSLIPVGLCSWYLGFPAGAAISAASALMLLCIDVLFGLDAYSRPTIPFWNNWMRLATFTLVAGLVSRLSAAVVRETEASAFKSKMLSLVTHEFNHSLTVIGVALSMLEDGKGGDEKSRSVIKTIERQHALLRQLVSNYLNYNRMQQGRLALTFKPTLASGLVEDCVRLLEPLSRQVGIEVSLKFPKKEAMIRADSDALALVVSNLIGNAIKFTPKGGKVTISLATPKRSPGKLKFSVEDTGVGLGKEEQLKIREGVYFKQPAALTSPQSFGLGLRLVEELLQKHDSSLTIQSWPGQGSTFSFELPIWKETKETPEPAEPVPTS